jgi:uncharacterized membrane protein YdbT with pleckstrin-like domain
VPFSRKLLNSDEEIVLDLHPHWWFFFQPLVTLVGAVILGILLFSNILDLPDVFNVPAGVVILVALGWFGIRYAQWITTNFVVTTDRLIYRSGVLSKHGVEIPLDRVNTVFFSQRLIERMLGAGDLVIESAGEMGRQSFTNVRKPSAVQNEIYKQMEANENRKFDRVGRGAGTAGGESREPSIPDQIHRLDELRRSGAITEDEYQAKKTQLLDRM